MSEEIKLIIALAESVGFKIEQQCDYQERFETLYEDQDFVEFLRDIDKQHRYLMTEKMNAYIKTPNGRYKSRLKSPIINYIVTPPNNPIQ